MKKLLILLFLVGLVFSTLPGDIYSYTFTKGWKVSYSIADGYIYVESFLNNKGNVGFGFGGVAMTGIDICLLTYDGSKVIVQDRSYITPPSGTPRQVLQDTERTPAGTDDCDDVGSTYDSTTGDWHALFKRKLVTGDAWDNDIIVDSDFQVAIAIFGQFEWGKKHLDRERQIVKLISTKTTTGGTGGTTGQNTNTNTGNTNPADNANTAQSTYSTILVSFIIDLFALIIYL